MYLYLILWSETTRDPLATYSNLVEQLTNRLFCRLLASCWAAADQRGIPTNERPMSPLYTPPPIPPQPPAGALQLAGQRLPSTRFNFLLSLETGSSAAARVSSTSSPRAFRYRYSLPVNGHKLKRKVASWTWTAAILGESTLKIHPRRVLHKKPHFGVFFAVGPFTPNICLYRWLVLIRYHPLQRQ